MGARGPPRGVSSSSSSPPVTPHPEGCSDIRLNTNNFFCFPEVTSPTNRCALLERPFALHTPFCLSPAPRRGGSKRWPRSGQCRVSSSDRAALLQALPSILGSSQAHISASTRGRGGSRAAGEDERSGETAGGAQVSPSPRPFRVADSAPGLRKGPLEAGAADALA